MIPFSRGASLWLARTSLVILALSMALFGAWMAGDLRGLAAAQKKPRVEEEEEAPKAKTPPKKRRVEEKEDAPKTKTPAGKKQRIEEEEDVPRTKPKRKVIRPDEEDEPKAKSGANRAEESAPGGDLQHLAEQAKNPAIKELFRSLALPHDLATYKPTRVTKSGEPAPREEKIEPLSLYLGSDPSLFRHERFRFTPLTHDGQRGKPFEPLIERLESVRPYEEIAQDKVRQFLKAGYDQRDPDTPGYLSRYDMLVAAEQVLSVVLRWHESAKQTGQRRGEGWSAVESKLRKQLLDDVLMEQLKALAQARDWDKVLDLTRRLAGAYTQPTERERIFRPVADLIQNALKDPTISEPDKEQVLKRLHDLEMEYPDNPEFRPLSDTLRDAAQRLLDAAKESARANKEQQAREYLLRAKQTWPQLPGLREFDNELTAEHPLLRVGVRGPLPQYLSPAWACTDNERRAVELLFESLVKLVPDEAGGFRYQPALAEHRPRIVPLGRQFDLPRQAFWSDGRQVSSTDIDVSLTLLQDGLGVGRSRVWGDPLAAAERKKDPFQVTVRLKQGFLDPLALMTFKILPRDHPVNSEEFARRPVTSGPFRLDRSRQSDESRRACLFFVANSAYSARPAKRGAPRLEEIRLYASTNPVEELSTGKLDLALDLTAKEAQELLEKQRGDRLPIEVPKPSSAVPNRRIYFLAINARKLPDAKVRRALAFAINRETLLDKHFRGAAKFPCHRALNGPFPMGSWACNPDVREHPNQNSQDLHDADQARNLSQEPAVRQAAAAGALTLKYPRGDPALEEAMKELSAQVKTLTGVVLEPAPCDPYKLRDDVEQRQSYDLAYYHYDFPDETYWLAPLLGPPPGASGGKNLFKFSNAEISKLLAGVGSYRDFAMVRKFQWQIHEVLNAEMPFIPLWQLDSLLAYRSEVKPAALDPRWVFTNIEEWRLQRK